MESRPGGGADAERGRYRRRIAPQERSVADVVVHERRLVEHLHRARQIDGIAQRHRGGRGQQTGAGQHQAGPDPFTGDGQDVAVDGIETATADEDFVQPIGDQGQLIGWTGQRRSVNA